MRKAPTMVGTFLLEAERGKKEESAQKRKKKKGKRDPLSLHQ